MRPVLHGLSARRLGQPHRSHLLASISLLQVPPAGPASPARRPPLLARRRCLGCLRTASPDRPIHSSIVWRGAAACWPACWPLPLPPLPRRLSARTRRMRSPTPLAASLAAMPQKSTPSWYAAAAGLAGWALRCLSSHAACGPCIASHVAFSPPACARLLHGGWHMLLRSPPIGASPRSRR